MMTEKSNIRIGIVTARYNEGITDRLLKGALERLHENNLLDSQIESIRVPGCIEIPLIVDLLASKKNCDAIIALGAVVRGETTHYDYVCKQVSDGCQSLTLKHQIPIIFGILTTESSAQAWERCGGKQGHKGVEAVDCALEMIQLVRKLKSN